MEVDSPQTNKPVMQNLPEGYFLIEPIEPVAGGLGVRSTVLGGKGEIFSTPMYVARYLINYISTPKDCRVIMFTQECYCALTTPNKLKSKCPRFILSLRTKYSLTFVGGTAAGIFDSQP